MYFYIQNKETENIENKINDWIKKLILEIKKNKYLSKYILNFWLVWPTWRWQGFYFSNSSKSDFDFYFITNFINPFLASKISNLVKNIFNKDLDCSALIVFKWIFKKPDLMFFEYSNSWMQLYWEKIKAIPLDKISKFESFRNIIYRSCFFLNLFKFKDSKLVLKEKDKEKYLYYYSKVIFAIWEVKLILKNKYIADNFKRNEIIKDIDASLFEEHNKMHLFRYENIIPNDFDFKTYTTKAIELLNNIYNELFNNLISKDDLKTIHPNLLSRIVNKVLFIKNYKSKYNKFEINFEEDFIVLILKHFDLIEKLNNKKTVTNKELETVLNYWRTASWFYYMI